MSKIAISRATHQTAFFYCIGRNNLKSGGDFMDNLNTLKGKLTVKQEKFCLEYAKSGNATKTYLSAYSPNNSNSAAGSEAHKLLKIQR